MVPQTVTRVDQEQTDVLANPSKVGYERDWSVVCQWCYAFPDRQVKEEVIMDGPFESG